MAPKKRSRPRRRCSECHQRFIPHRSALESQKTCCPACRLKRRARLKRERRAASLDEFRKDERERQRTWRAGEQERQSCATGRSSGEPSVSRTTLDPRLAEIVAELTKTLDGLAPASSPVSRTTLEEARAVVLKSFDDLEARLAFDRGGQRGSPEAGVTAPPHFAMK